MCSWKIDKSDDKKLYGQHKNTNIVNMYFGDYT